MSVQPTGGTPTLRARPRARGTVRRVASAATTLAVVAALVLLGVHNGYPAQRPNLLFGAAWLSSTQVGQLTLLDGSSAEVVARVRTAPAGDKLDAVQEGATAYAVNRTAGTVRRVDGATHDVTAPATPLPDAGDGLRAFAGHGSLYVLDTRRGVLTGADPVTLATRGRSVPLAAQISTDATGLDDAGRLWVLDAASGDLVWLRDGKRHSRPSGTGPGGGLLTIAAGTPVVVDVKHRTATAFDPDTGTPRHPVALDLRPDDTVQISGSPHDPRLYIVADRGVLDVCDLDADGCGTAVALGSGSSRLGAAVEASDRVFVPDFTTGQVWIVDLRTSRVLAQPRVLDRAAQFQLLTRDGIVFFNDPDSAAAGVIELDGTVRKVDKYDKGSERGDNGTAGPQSPPDHPKKPDLPKQPDQPKQPGQPDPPPGQGDPNPQPPPPGNSVDISVSNGTPFVADPVSLEAFNPKDGGPQPVATHWDFDDAQTSEQLKPRHQWDTAREYHVRVVATFPDGATASAIRTVTVSDRPVTRPVLTVLPPSGGHITGPNGINCPGKCSADFDPGVPAPLSTTADNGNVQTGWGNDCGGTAPGTTCTVTMTTNHTVSATFGPPQPPPRPKLTVAAPANGHVTGPNGIDCPGACSATFNQDEAVTLTAIPDNNFVVASWGGNCGGAGTTCDLTMSGNRTASVRFKRVTKTLTLDNQPFELNDGTGIRTSTGQFCHTHCVFTLNAGVPVTLTEVDNGLNFSGWGGDCAGSGTNTSCTLTMDTNHSVSTDFSNQGFARAAAVGPGTAEVRRSRRPRAGRLRPGRGCPMLT